VGKRNSYVIEVACKLVGVAQAGLLRDDDCNCIADQFSHKEC